MFGKNFIKYVTSMAAALLVGAFASGSSASTSFNEKINTVVVSRLSSNIAYVVMTTPIPAAQRPSCHQSGWDRTYVFDISTSKGKAMLSLLMSAFLAGKTVEVSGPGSGTQCTTIGPYVVETLSEVAVW